MAKTPSTIQPLLPPKLDVVFKSLFATEPAMLADLLNAVLTLDGYAPAVDVQVRNPDIDRETVTAKQIMLDIRAIDEQGRQFNVELQVQQQTAYIQRALYYLSRLHATQLQPGQLYDELKSNTGHSSTRLSARPANANLATLF